MAMGLSAHRRVRRHSCLHHWRSSRFGDSWRKFRHIRYVATQALQVIAQFKGSSSYVLNYLFTPVVPTATTSPTFISDAPVPSISPTAEETSPLQTSSPVPSTSFTATSSTLTLSEPSQTIASSDSTSSNSPSSSPSASTSAGLIPSDPSQFSNSSDTSLSAGAIAGIVFGSLALIILLLLLLVFCSRRRRKRRNESDFTIVDPEGYPGDSAVRRTPSGSYQSVRTSRVPIAVQRTRASSPRRFMSEQSRRPEIIAANPDESSALMSYHHREGVITDNESRLDAPPIMLQKPRFSRINTSLSKQQFLRHDSQYRLHQNKSQSHQSVPSL